ncbi:MAG: SpoIID/LytB domain-containing protein [Elusimicrobiales bacterium]|nr:SpoIID/LytB domain-containing protein [Elusimicrobiales bacterium]
MRKHTFFRPFFTLVFCLPAALAWAQPAVQTAPAEQAAGQTVSKSSLAASRVDSKLNETVLHKSVLDYALPADIAAVAKKCAAGEADECYFSFKTFENAPDPKVAAAANLELAVLSMQRGLVKQALAYIARAAEINPDDPFTQLTQGWMLLSAGKYKKSRQAFGDLMYLTADFEYVSSAKLGTALAWYFGGDKEKAASELQYLYTSNPYAISFVSYMLGRIASEMKSSKKLAPVFLQQALSHDEKNYAAAELYARLSEKEKNKLRAWQYYATLYSLDPDNKTLAKKLAKYAKSLGDKSIDYLFYLRLEQPIVHVMESTPSAEVKMALYANREQIPQALQSAAVMGSGTLKVTDEKLGEVLRVPSYTEKTVVFNPETGGVDLKDAKGHVEFSAKRPFTLTPENASRTLLVRNARAENIFAADLSDKELKGALTVIPGKNGFTLVNAVYAEDLIPALLATQAQDVKDPAALKALAVVFRSALLQAVEAHAARSYHITDNDDTFKFKGINLIFKDLLDASKRSGEIRLTEAQAGFYTACGVVTADSLENSAVLPGYVYSPANVSKYLLSNPPADLYSRPHDPTQWAGVKWMYWYDAKEIQNRLAYKQNIGKLRAIVPVRMTPQGRILSMRFEGSKGSYETTSPQETAFILSAGTMRSNLFDIVPLYKGKNIKSVLVRGYDTGLGYGLCLRGADGLAKEGADYMGIIKYYFPQARILNTTTGTVN